ncbi:hypothetical protein BLNAU_21579 [Blattamonas nauphoetae]|uniref:RRM domain-containing protein n=1 Tax=Blattamonas nauphoetae TaxID=2049346 RepID=A0ABQ9WZQ7_9EUKA|nr:hypothetical protein BLNAU_21579 [Blattamonas nauphoetae]
MSLLKRSQNNEDIVSIDHTFETRTKEWLACYKTRRDSVIARKKIAQYRHRHGRRLWEILYPNIGCFNNVLHIQFNPPSIQKRPITLQNLTAFYYSILGFFSRYECSEVEIHVHRTEFKGYGRILFKESLNGGRLADHCLSEVNKLIPQVTFPITVGEGPTQLTLNLSFTLSINKPRITPQPPTNRSILPLPPIKATDHMRPQPAVSFAIPQPVPQISQSTPIRSSQRHQSHHRRAKSMPDLTHGPEQESENEIDKEDDQDSGFSESIHESILDDGSTPEKSSFVYTSDDSPPKDASSSDTIL